MLVLPLSAVREFLSSFCFLVRTTVDSTLDAELLKAIVDLGVQKIKQLDDSIASTFNFATLVENFSTFLGRSTAEGTDAPSTLDFERLWWWRFTREPAIPDFLNGPIATERKPRTVAGVSRTKKQVLTETRPQDVILCRFQAFFVRCCCA